MGASRSPARARRDGARDVRTSHSADLPRSSTSRTAAAESSAGSVLGMATTAVNPPSAAAREPVSTVSASSRPGSRRCVCRSTSPGAITQLVASSVSVSSASMCSAMARDATVVTYRDIGDDARRSRR